VAFLIITLAMALGNSQQFYFCLLVTLLLLSITWKRFEQLEEYRDAENRAKADDFSARLAQASDQQNEYEAFLANMIEGVLAIGLERDVKYFNQAAARILNISTLQVESIKARNRHVLMEEVIRVPEVLDFLVRFLNGQGVHETEVRLYDDKERFVQIRANKVISSKGVYKGTVVVMHDITNIKQLELYRKQFVANVSHELKTPLTSIQGFTELLLEKKARNEEERDEFLRIIDRHVARIAAIVSDLLTLSSLENLGTNLHMTDIPLRPIIEDAIGLCQIAATKANISLRIQAGPNIWIKANRSLFEQALVNLIDNAIKYSAPDQLVEISTRVISDKVFVDVKDHGIGIASMHLPRIFERFYRIDQARSRKMGGTGLGLSIVKHIALSHNGNVYVESMEGQGSKFTIEVPLGSVI
jgi:two-component system phosphate regulon sensor histidine kinase PhoR